MKFGGFYLDSLSYEELCDINNSISLACFVSERFYGEHLHSLKKILEKTINIEQLMSDQDVCIIKVVKKKHEK